MIPRLPAAWRQRFLRTARWSAAAAGALVVGIVALAAWRARFTAPEPTILLLDSHGRFLGSVGEGKDGEHGYWPVAKLPPRVVAATLALEDRRFWSHPGVDPAAVL